METMTRWLVPMLPFAIAIVGCGGPGQPAQRHAEKPTAAADWGNLSPEDVQLAKRQQFCPITKERFGHPRPPIKVRIQDRTVFVCCPGCVEKLTKSQAAGGEDQRLAERIDNFLKQP